MCLVRDPIRGIVAQFVQHQGVRLLAKTPVDHEDDDLQIIQADLVGRNGHRPVNHNFPHRRGQHAGGFQEADEAQTGGAQVILIPEVSYDLEEVASLIRRRHRRGEKYSVVVVAEGVVPPHKTEVQKDAFGFDRLGGVAYQLAPRIEELTGYETRVTVLGHLQRGGTPSAFDRVLATRLGTKAADLAIGGESGVMVAMHGSEIISVPLALGCSEIRGVDADLYETAETFFG